MNLRPSGYEPAEGALPYFLLLPCSTADKAIRAPRVTSSPFLSRALRNHTAEFTAPFAMQGDAPRCVTILTATARCAFRVPLLRVPHRLPEFLHGPRAQLPRCNRARRGIRRVRRSGGAARDRHERTRRAQRSATQQSTRWLEPSDCGFATRPEARPS